MSRVSLVIYFIFFPPRINVKTLPSLSGLTKPRGGLDLPGGGRGGFLFVPPLPSPCVSPSLNKKDDNVD